MGRPRSFCSDPCWFCLSLELSSVWRTWTWCAGGGEEAVVRVIAVVKPVAAYLWRYRMLKWNAFPLQIFQRVALSLFMFTFLPRQMCPRLRVTLTLSFYMYNDNVVGGCWQSWFINPFIGFLPSHAECCYVLHYMLHYELQFPSCLCLFSCAFVLSLVNWAASNLCICFPLKWLVGQKITWTG